MFAECFSSMGHFLQQKPDKNLVIIGVRSCVFMYMVAVTVLFGWATYYFLSENEFQLRETSYEGVSLDLGGSVQSSLEHNFQASLLMAEIAGAACPTTEQWPNCTGFSYQQYFRYGEIFRGFAPQLNFLSVISLITPDQVASFEAFAHDYFAEQGHGENDSVPFGYSDFGFGIKAQNQTTLEVEHSTLSFPGGKQNILAPVLYSTGAVAMLQNVYFEENRVRSVDEMFDCVDAAATAQEKKNDCGVVTEIIGTFSSYISPIFPAENNTTLVGFTSSFFLWSQVLDGHLAPNSRAVVAVISSGTQSVSFEVGGGLDAVTFLGEGDLHDSELDSYVEKFSLVDPSPLLNTVTYSLHVYPSSGFLDPTGFPILGGILASTVIVMTGLVVLAYDQVVSRKAREQKIVDDTKRLFVRYISHEIRTPLNTVHLGLVFLKADITGLVKEISSLVPAKALEQISSWVGLVEEIEDSGDIAVSVLDDLINYDKIVMGALNLEVSEVAIVDCIQSNVRSFSLAARERGIDLQLKLQPPVKLLSDIICVGDSVKLEIVVRNLVSNAVKFSSAGGLITVAVSLDDSNRSTEEKIDLEHRGRNPVAGGSLGNNFDYDSVQFRGWLVLSVSDSGVGMTQENLSQLFQEGVQFNANSLQGGKGSGLGLWVTKGFVERHGGEITADSTGIGCGTTFIVRLPAYENINRSRRSSSEVSRKSDVLERHADLESGGSSRSCNSTSSQNTFAGMNAFASVRTTEPPLVVAAGTAAAAAAVAPVPVPVAEELVVSNRADVGSSSAPSALAQQVTETRFKHVLLVDDSVPTRKMLGRLLTRANMGVCTHAGDGATALKLVSSNPTKFDLILMDFEMPIMDGPAATRAIRECGVTCPIIGITGNVLPADTIIFLNAGANRVLSKPVTMPLLLASIDELLAVTHFDTAASATSAAVNEK